MNTDIIITRTFPDRPNQVMRFQPEADMESIEAASFAQILFCVPSAPPGYDAWAAIVEFGLERHFEDVTPTALPFYADGEHPEESTLTKLSRELKRNAGLPVREFTGPIYAGPQVISPEEATANNDAAIEALMNPAVVESQPGNWNAPDLMNPAAITELPPNPRKPETRSFDIAVPPKDVA